MTISVLRNPPATASYLFMPAFSLRNKSDKITTRNGAINVTTTASASGTKISPVTKHTGKMTATVPRNI